MPILRERAIKDKAGSTRQGALRVLAKHWPDHPETLPFLREREKNDSSKKVRDSAEKLIEELEE